ncbi:MAG: aminodeoxychorismate synthase component I [bacterium]|nr:aminodeoxychorismate synthase component I [bacterium]
MSGGSLFLLDSAGPAGELSRWSLLGSHPVARFASSDGINRFHWHSRGQNFTWQGDPLAALRQVLAAFPKTTPRADIPFAGGAVGVFAYELGRRILPLQPSAEDDLELPDISLFFYDRCLLFDHAEHRMMAVGWARGRDEMDAEREATLKAGLLAEELRSLLAENGADSATPPTARGGALPCSPSVCANDYRAAVTRCREEIREGNAYELCFTGRFEAPFSDDPRALYRELKKINPAPFAAFLRHPEMTLISSSPERFLKMDAWGRIEARPIKGTRPRGRVAAEDEKLRLELENSEKDRAENVMIVDLLRNDLHRVCIPGSVDVPDLCVIEEYSSVFQMVSSITGQLHPDLDRCDLLASSFPGGSMTGAPKIAAMDILEELEPRVRGNYSGCLGYLGFDGSLDLSIVIRSIQLINGRAVVGAGGAVVYDSDPEDEWREALHKADAPLRALAGVQGYQGYELVENDRHKKQGSKWTP